MHLASLCTGTARRGTRIAGRVVHLCGDLHDVSQEDAGQGGGGGRRRIPRYHPSRHYAQIRIFAERRMGKQPFPIPRRTNSEATSRSREMTIHQGESRGNRYTDGNARHPEGDHAHPLQDAGHPAHFANKKRELIRKSVADRDVPGRSRNTKRCARSREALRGTARKSVLIRADDSTYFKHKHEAELAGLINGVLPSRSIPGKFRCRRSSSGDAAPRLYHRQRIRSARHSPVRNAEREGPRPGTHGCGRLRGISDAPARNGTRGNIPSPLNRGFPRNSSAMRI